jgi:hypothetical protein
VDWQAAIGRWGWAVDFDPARLTSVHRERLEDVSSDAEAAADRIRQGDLLGVASGHWRYVPGNLAGLSLSLTFEEDHPRQSAYIEFQQTYEVDMRVVSRSTGRQTWQHLFLYGSHDKLAQAIVEWIWGLDSTAPGYSGYWCEDRDC